VDEPGISGQEISYGLDPTIYNDATYKNDMVSSFMSIPTISLVTDLRNLFNPDSGIYVNALLHGEEWERAASIELLNPDSSDGFQENCGIRIREVTAGMAGILNMPLEFSLKKNTVRKN